MTRVTALLRSDQTLRAFLAALLVVVILAVLGGAALVGSTVIVGAQQRTKALNIAAQSVAGRNAASARSYARITTLTREIDLLVGRSTRAVRQRERLETEVRALVRELRNNGIAPDVPPPAASSTSKHGGTVGRKVQPSPHPSRSGTPRPSVSPHPSSKPAPSARPTPSPSPTPSHCLLIVCL